MSVLCVRKKIGSTLIAITRLGPSDVDIEHIANVFSATTMPKFTMPGTQVCRERCLHTSVHVSLWSVGSECDQISFLYLPIFYAFRIFQQEFAPFAWCSLYFVHFSPNWMDYRLRAHGYIINNRNASFLRCSSCSCLWVLFSRDRRNGRVPA